ncbi:hypothetical protein L6164_034356 [Bauhinia variegata]|uniref:Uncharacterized protein n=1 Tax=Bauhinia variegata TaxID=167791 RepID=A0ACB9KUN0_BAUVA|nr:hypothetical protein L6164_034356 [Bauhinia variegata]
MISSALFSLSEPNLYPRVKVRVPEQEDNKSQENDSGTWLFLKFIESLYFEEEENTSTKSPLSIVRGTVTEAYPQHLITRSTPASKGMVKGIRQNGEGAKGNVRASSVPRPRAVLSSPENDGIYASINGSNNHRLSDSSHRRNKGVQEKVGVEAKAKAINRKTPPSHRTMSTLRACHAKRGQA